jgi:hypothetical protein
MPLTWQDVMNSARAYESVQKILEAHRRGLCDLERAVALLHKLWGRASENDRKDIENALWTTLSAEPLAAARQVGNYSADVLRVVVRAIATFGPTANLPNLVFGRLPLRDVALAVIWAQGICHELSYSMLHHADRFAQGTLNVTKALCATYTFARSAQLAGAQFPQAVIDAAAELGQIVERIEFSRFAASLDEEQQPPQTQVSELERLLAAAGISTEIKAAMEEADSYLRGTGQFDSKHAADLIRACMEETHRSVVAELGRITGGRFEGPDEDGRRRTYMRQADFINEDEERFFSCIYTLISRQGTHRLLAPRETVLVMHRTVRDYLLLLLRRLVARKSLLPPVP